MNEQQNRIPRETIDRIVRDTDILALISESVELKRRADNEYIGLCPFHSEKTPSFTVNTAERFWYCFGACQEGGNATAFLMKHRGIKFIEALRILADKAGIEILNNNTNYKSYQEYQKKAEAEVLAFIKAPTPKPEPETPAKEESPTAHDEHPPEHPVIPESVWKKFEPIPEKMLQRLNTERGWTIEAIVTLDLRLASYGRNKKGEIYPIKTPDRIAIPVRNSKGDLVNIRLYKPFDRDKDEIKIFSWGKGYGKNELLFSYNGEGAIIYCEGESDFVCAVSHGLNAATMTSKPDGWADEQILRFKGLEVIIACDADAAGIKYNLSAFKNLNGIAKSVRILNWPDCMGLDKEGNYPESSGQDLTDFFVKHGKSAEDLLELANLDDKGREIPKEIEIRGKSHIGVINGCYWKLKQTTQGSMPEYRISNFVLRITRTIKTINNKRIRKIEITSKETGFSVVADITTEEMTSKSKFSQWCLEQGPFTFSGTQIDIESLWEYLIANADNRDATELPFIGRHPDGFWIFKDSLIKEDDKARLLPDEDGIIWINDKNGFQCADLDRSENKGYLSTLTPYLVSDLTENEAGKFRKDIISLFYENIGFNSYLALGFVAYCIYAKEIFPICKNPILFISGAPESGKNTIGAVIVAHFGLDERYAEPKSITTPSLRKRLSYFSSIPVWIDDYRSHDEESVRHDEMFRCAFDGTAASKSAMGNDFGIIGSAIRACLMITGESFASDSALSSRCVEISTSQRVRKDSYLKQILDIKENLSAVTLQIIKEKTPEKARNLIEAIKATKADLEKEGLSSRLAGCYAAISESFIEIFAPNPDVIQEGFREWLIARSCQTSSLVHEASILTDFFQDIDLMIGTGYHIIEKYMTFQERTQTLAIHMPGLYSEWQEYCRKRGKRIWARQAIEQNLKSEPFFVEKPNPKKNYPYKNVKIADKVQKCFILNTQDMPDEMQRYSQWFQNSSWYFKYKENSDAN